MKCEAVLISSEEARPTVAALQDQSTSSWCFGDEGIRLGIQSTPDVVSLDVMDCLAPLRFIEHVRTPFALRPNRTPIGQRDIRSFAQPYEFIVKPRPLVALPKGNNRPPHPCKAVPISSGLVATAPKQLPELEFAPAGTLRSRTVRPTHPSREPGRHAPARCSRAATFSLGS